MSEVVIRRATDADAAAIWSVYNEAVANSTASWDHEPVELAERQAWLTAHNTGRYQTLIAELDGEVVGFGGYGSYRDKAGYVDTAEHTIYLAPAARGKGLGTELLSRLIAAARSVGFHALIGGLSGDNEASLKLHNRFGFVEVGRMPQVGQKFGRWLDLVFVQLLLDERPHPGDCAPDG